MCQVGLKLAQWFWRRLLNVVNVFSLFRYNLPLEKSKASIWTNLNPHHPGMLCNKFCWNWPHCSGDFLNLSMNYFAISLSSPLGKGHCEPFIFTNLNAHRPRKLNSQFWLKLTVWFLRKRWKCKNFTDRRTDYGQPMIRKTYSRFQFR